MRREWFFLRHGQTDYNSKGIVQGSGVDSSINQIGLEQANSFFEKYRTTNFNKIIVSELQRTYQTVHPFIEKGIPFEKDIRINEMNWGVHEGKSSDKAMIDLYKKMIGEWSIGNFNASLEEGESAAELSSRLGVFIDHLKSRTEERLLICTHGRSMRCLITLLKNQHLREMETVHHANTGLYKVIYEKGELHFELENDTSHLL